MRAPEVPPQRALSSSVVFSLFVLVREMRTGESVHPRAGERAQQRDDHHRYAATDQRDERTRTRTGQGPPQAENRSAREIANAAATFLRRQPNRLAVTSTQ